MTRQETTAFVLVEARQQRLQGSLDIADRTDGDGLTSADVGRISIDLDDDRPVRIELRPGEVSSEQKQHIAVENGVITGRSADDAGHADIAGIVVLDELLATRLAVISRQQQAVAGRVCERSIALPVRKDKVAPA